MNLVSHIDVLHIKHDHLETAVQEEQTRPMPDFITIARLKKQKLAIKEEIEKLQRELPKQSHG